jgi:hypothetical protein
MVQDNAQESRNSFLLTLLSNAEIADKKQWATKLKAIQQAEYMKKLWPKLQKYAKGEVRTGLDRVEVPIQDSDDEISSWRSVTSLTELFNTPIAWNIKHFSQAKGTPFVTGNLGQYLHPFEQNHFSESILKGTVNLAHLPLNASIRACINDMRFVLGEDGTDPVDDTISAEDFFGRIQTAI